MESGRVMLLCVLGLGVAVSGQDAGKVFSFEKHLVGTWDVHQFMVATSTSEMMPVSQSKYVFNSDPDTGGVVGYFMNNDEDEDGLVSKIPISIDFDAANTGNFKTGEDEELLFSFYFQNFNGPEMSFGEWNGQNPGFYQFQIVSGDKFLITVFPTDEGKDDDADSEVIVYSANRVRSAKDKTFFEKYGSTIMMVGGFMLFQRLKGDQRPAVTAPAGGPRVEEKVQ
eukprot:CAMPEP_0197517980 /NCGR_PEP_ID=MMETSP1318-20131121/3073_1 /TAXON_ID=552666 /ORGANISM="Partenskyella glossopodia, Strain RCC365" /LENGTH=224 /DNA_ID=CAMNT_0043067967 /DNA_START=6 /DNA_END=680 /DNA_ORIENTATION=-